MSIATSACVRPSFCLRFWLGVFCLAALAAGLLLAGAAGGARVGRYAAPGWGAAASLLAGLFFCRRFVLCSGARANLARIDIYAVGQIWVAVYHVMDGAGVTVAAPPAAGAAPARLLPGSTLWPGFLLLLLVLPDGRTLAWPICAGGVADEMFRPLSVACRTIAAHHGSPH